ncbi:MAG: hypothetical protein NZ960_01895 [Candidatus Kapabacteria bacterium]|nr:hypothetical protein [Candidatus Kapabacteria bacterium]MDW8011777.1 hypothetical protein [Bacteroidota bacterium]
MALMCSVSGLRFTADDFSPELIERMLHSFSQRLPEGPIAVSRDGRSGSELLEELVVTTLKAYGHRIHRLGIVPTPTTQVWIARRRLPGGISITASHNPAEWHGLKFLGAEGLTLDATLFYREARSTSSISSNGYRYTLHPVRWLHERAIWEHIQSLERPRWLRRLSEMIAHEHFHVVVDAVNASGSFLLPPFLQHLRCRITLLHADGSGVFPHPPEPLPQHLQELSEWVRRTGADIGIAVDPDGDRLVLVDETGTCLWEELTIALAVQAVLEQKEQACGRQYEPTVVVNYSTTSVVEAIAQQYGTNVLRSPVGELNVVQALRRARGVIGGEGSGGVILPHVHYGRDALVGCMLILGLMARSQRRLSELATALPRPIMHKYALTHPEPASAVIERIAASIVNQAKEVRRDDGLYARFGRGWFHLRPSNTEPIIRFVVEAPTHGELEQLEALVLPSFQRQRSDSELGRPL